ncbi:MAG: ROK family protein [Candidatus Limivivens sp.]|nr:ROK family protein [Candidatus Limivivens sp.]
MKQYLVFDAGGTFIKYALMNERAEILEKDKVPTPYYEDHVKEDFYRALDPVVDTYRERIAGIAISMPGMLDSRKGYCYSAGYLAYLAGSAVAPELEERFSLPVTIENDGKSAAQAELWKGSLKGYENGAVVVLGTGVGGGIVLNGKVYRGNHFTAGEYSYVLADPNRKYEMAGFWGISGGSPGLAQSVAAVTGEDPDTLNGLIIFERANAGDEKTLQGLRNFTDDLAIQIYNLHMILDLDIIALGGGISQQPLLLSLTRGSLEELAEKNPLKAISPYIPKPQVVTCTFYNDANLIGALYHYLTLKAGGIN